MDPDLSWWILMDAGGSTWWILVDSDSTSRMIQGVDHGGSQMWILVDTSGGVEWGILLDPD